jgi:hypothetical protein
VKAIVKFASIGSAPAPSFTLAGCGIRFSDGGFCAAEYGTAIRDRKRSEEETAIAHGARLRAANFMGKILRKGTETHPQSAM